MNEGLNYSERKEWARVLYTRLEKTTKDIALTISVEEATVRQWIREDAWDGVKRSLLISKAAQLEHLYNVLEHLNAKVKTDGGMSTKDVDLIIKYTAAIKNLEADTTVSNIIEVAELFVNWLRRKDLDLVKKVTLHLDAFIKQKLAA